MALHQGDVKSLVASRNFKVACMVITQVVRYNVVMLAQSQTDTSVVFSILSQGNLSYAFVSDVTTLT